MTFHTLGKGIDGQLGTKQCDDKSVPSSYYNLFLRKYAGFLNIALKEPEKEEENTDHIYDILSVKTEDMKSNYFIDGCKRMLLFGYIHRKIFFSFIALLFVLLFFRHIYQILNTGVKTEKSESLVKIITIESDPDERISIDIRDSIMIDEDKIKRLNLYSMKKSFVVCDKNKSYVKVLFYLQINTIKYIKYNNTYI